MYPEGVLGIWGFMLIWKSTSLRKPQLGLLIAHDMDRDQSDNVICELVGQPKVNPKQEHV